MVKSSIVGEQGVIPRGPVLLPEESTLLVFGNAIYSRRWLEMQGVFG